MAPRRQVIIGDDVADPWSEPLDWETGPMTEEEYNAGLGYGGQPESVTYMPDATSSTADADLARAAWLRSQARIAVQDGDYSGAAQLEEMAQEIEDRVYGRDVKQPSRPPQPSVTTSAQYIPQWNEVAQQWTMVANPNYRPPAGPTPNLRDLRASEYERWQMSRPDVLTANTNAPYITVMQADGTIGQVPNPNYLPPEAEQPDRITAWQQAQIDMGAQDRDAANYRQRLSSAGQMAGLLDQGARWAAPRLKRPGQTHFPGFGPGSTYERLLNYGGMGANPDVGKVVEMQYDPAAIWQAAMQRMGV
jgi:hypothetical protein